MNTITLIIDVVAVCPEPKELLNNFSKEENHFLQQHRKRKQNEQNKQIIFEGIKYYERQ